MDGYEPTDPDLRQLWSRLSPEARQSRLKEAQRRLSVVREIDARPAGESERHAVSRQEPRVDRSSVRRWRTRYEEHGLDGLIIRRLGPASKMPAEVRNVICTLRRADPDYPVETIVAHVLEHHGFSTSETNVKRILRAEGLARRPGPPQGKAVSTGEHRLELGGMKLVEAACVETGYLKELARGVAAHVENLPRPEEPKAPDTSDRDEHGRFLSSYNDRYSKGPDDEIGPGFASVSLKRDGLDPDRLQVSQVKLEVIERKLLALQVSPLLGNGRWDGIRVPRGALLEELCGYEYMPATLDKFTRELKYAGVSNTLWEIHARHWLDKQTTSRREERRAAVLYVDGTTKPIWTRLFSQSTKVSQVGRVMPGLEVVAFHSGYGVPLWMVTHSGRAPLVRAIPKALAELERIWGPSSVGRIVVIDAEANSVPFLKGLEQGEPSRAWVTRLRADWVEGKRIFNRTNYRPYRDGDRVRMGMADFNDPDGDTYRMRVVEVERRTTGKVTYLGASLKLDDREWKPHHLADLYFDRWPAQEANFRVVNQAAGFKKVHGYGKQLVDNISVVTELDELAGKNRRAEERLKRQKESAEASRKRVHEMERELARRKRRLETVGRHVSARIVTGRPITPKANELLREQGSLAEEIQERTEQLTKNRESFAKTEAQLDRTKQRLTKYRDRRDLLDERREIFAHDVELDSLFSLIKVGLVLLVSHVLKEYLGDARMAVTTFLDHMATLPARLRMTPELEIVTFEYNQRDPEVMGLLESCCDAINARSLQLRSGRRLRVKVDPAPNRGRPRPPGSRVGSGDRFKR